jgi:hypothetical protein
MDARVALVLDRLGTDEVQALLLFPPDGRPMSSVPPGMDSILRGFLALDLVDPAGMVSFRVQLVEAGSDGLRLSRLGRAAAAEIRARA